MSLNYAKEKLHVAVSTLSTGTADIQTRLADAYISSVIRIRDEDLPPDLRRDLKAITKAITRVPAKGDEGSVRATVDTMSDNQCSELAAEIFELHEAVNRLLRNA